MNAHWDSKYYFSEPFVLGRNLATVYHFANNINKINADNITEKSLLLFLILYTIVTFAKILLLLYNLQ